MTAKLVKQLTAVHPGAWGALLAVLVAVAVAVGATTQQQAARHREIADGLSSTNAVEPALCVMRLEKRWFGYVVYRPAHFDRHRKYPLLVGKVRFQAQDTDKGPAWASALANAGAYVAIAYRSFGGTNDWATEVMGVYHELTPDPTIDSHRVFLFSNSAGAAAMTKLVEDDPTPWRGTFLFDSDEGVSNRLSPPGMRPPRIFPDHGTNDPKFIQTLADFVFDK